MMINPHIFLQVLLASASVLSKVDDFSSICLKFYFVESKSSLKILYFLESRK